MEEQHKYTEHANYCSISSKDAHMGPVLLHHAAKVTTGC